ncbi:hypothetical protein DFJ69_6122 [Thermomonospora umbrina]|uniref:Uncharacterized protein n=1 Tax=Thermomonospora umbrina TaxID=111806 RepID=A0A3D9T9X1_9ACTN|nr:hypothetical protein DFJ69_6122 [Thermomonospora umbrina]
MIGESRAATSQNTGAVPGSDEASDINGHDPIVDGGLIAATTRPMVQ